MASPTTVKEMITTLKAARAEWDSTIQQLTPEQFVQPDVCGWWTVKDVIAHVGWFENQMVHMIAERSVNNASEWWLLPADDRNDNIYQTIKDKPLAEILKAERGSYAAMFDLIIAMQDDELSDPSKFEGMPPDWKPADIIAQNAWEHYAEHLKDIHPLL